MDGWIIVIMFVVVVVLVLMCPGQWCEQPETWSWTLYCPPADSDGGVSSILRPPIVYLSKIQWFLLPEVSLFRSSESSHTVCSWGQRLSTVVDEQHSHISDISALYANCRGSVESGSVVRDIGTIRWDEIKCNKNVILNPNWPSSPDNKD